MPAAWSTQQLAEFLAMVSASERESAAALAAVERAAEALDAEVAAVVCDGDVLAAVGYPDGAVPVDRLASVTPGAAGCDLEVPGAGRCAATAVALDHPPGATLVIARSGPHDLRPEEASLLRGMARVTSMTMRILHLLEDERAARGELERLLKEQAALRHVATLVASQAKPEEIFAAVAQEAAHLLGADLACVCRAEVDGSTTVVAGWSSRGSYDQRLGEGSSVQAPIVVDGREWGVMIVASVHGDQLGPGSEERLAAFAELVATAISNAASRAQLAASRARIVATADETRRRIERDLHDGTQQRLVTLGLDLRAARDALPPGHPELSARLTRVEKGLEAVLDELREISRGVHPAILSEGGLTPALKSVCRRAAIPVELDAGGVPRLPEPIEVAAYYVVCEALVNATRHARASRVHVRVEVRDGVLCACVADDGIGGADPARGSGILGLMDRAEALGGKLTVASPPGEGTTVTLELPVACG